MKTIETTLTNGGYGGIKLIEPAGCTFSVWMVPRDHPDRVSVDNIERKCAVYFLVNRLRDEIYVGQTTKPEARPFSHKRKKFWDTAFVATSALDSGGDLDIAGVKYLEYAAIKRLESFRAKISNGQVPDRPPIKRNRIGLLDNILEEIFSIMALFGFDYLPIEGGHDASKSKSQKQQNYYYLRKGVIDAFGWPDRSTGNFVLSKGSVIRVTTNPSYSRGNDDLLEERSRVVKSSEACGENAVRLVEDIPFKTPSAAASFAMGNPASGPFEFKDARGVSLKELIAIGEANKSGAREV